jgi:hypothetical protein
MRHRPLDIFAGGTRTRSTVAYRQIGAPTDGSAAFLVEAAINELRIENRGDGLGDMLLMEGSRTNLLLRSAEFDNASWNIVGTVTANAANAPDGTVSADRVQSLSGVNGINQNPATTVSTRHAGSVWQRDPLGTLAAWQLILGQSTGSASQGLLTPVWARATHSRVSNAIASEGLYIADGRDWSGSGGLVAGARDLYGWGAQLEVGAFASSYIRTAGASATRAADVLSYAVGQYPASFLTRGFRLTFAPDFSSSEIPASAIYSLLGITPFTNGEVAIYQSGGIYLGVRKGDGTGAEFTAATLSWSRGQLLTIEVLPGVSLATSGFTSGNQTKALTGGAWPSAALTLARRSDGTAPYFGRFGRYIETL